jgi:hypothetical protein
MFFLFSDPLLLLARRKKGAKPQVAIADHQAGGGIPLIS